MDRFHQLQVFVAVADCNGFASAARRLAMSPPTVTRAIAMLEDRLGTRLFTRTTRAVRLTESGERLLGDSKRILTDLEEAEKAAVGSHAAPRGELHITAPVLFGRLYVSPIIGEFLDQFPLVNATTLYIDRNVSMMDEGMDVAVRIGHLPDSSLSATQVGTVRRVTFASPGYLDRYGSPGHPSELSRHKIIQPSAVDATSDWVYLENGRPLTVHVQPRLRMNTNDAVLEVASRGWGVSQLLSYQIAPMVSDGRLRPILQRYDPHPLPIHVLHQEGRLVSAKVRAFVDFMVDRLRANETLQ